MAGTLVFMDIITGSHELDISREQTEHNSFRRPTIVYLNKTEMDSFTDIHHHIVNCLAAGSEKASLHHNVINDESLAL